MVVGGGVVAAVGAGNGIAVIRESGGAGGGILLRKVRKPAVTNDEFVERVALYSHTGLHSVMHGVVCWKWAVGSC